MLLGRITYMEKNKKQVLKEKSLIWSSARLQKRLVRDFLSKGGDRFELRVGRGRF